MQEQPVLPIAVRRRLPVSLLGFFFPRKLSNNSFYKQPFFSFFVSMSSTILWFYGEPFLILSAAEGVFLLFSGIEAFMGRLSFSPVEGELV